jgi:hypothetical protein
VRLSRADIQAIARALAIELRSGRASSVEIDALVEGNDQCEKEFTDPMNTETVGDASSLERMAREDIERLRRGQPLRPTPRLRAARRKASR